MSFVAAVAARLQRDTIAMQTTSTYSVHDPDGVPHQIVGLTWVFALVAALAAFAALTIGGVVSALALIVVPATVIGLVQRAERQRNARARR
jgi:hypothetical protein